jgi:hypothetical protein
MNRLRVALDTGDERRVVLPPEADLDEGSENDLKAHRELEHGRRLPRQDPSLVQDVLRQDE